ncbi:hypothetical protein N7509_000273 [Penicillium cosmopolitanum]|uniref:C-CAP/cofactor C-like domain-containing protein n=1 Tax=Penicillium cosmopolitanum TaxID=1131564 RepID=A0A9W9WA07_9EURO|nr:uncharacterized protein N7509_000273 [Penicillium cosmopolitanum]KAJ5413646.1 hypothetical protein N7509_000273 [Penicillium cosmopolitanum]
MVEPELQHAHRLSADKQIVSKAEIPLKERFFPYFQREITALQEKMDGFAHESLVDGERAEVTDHCLAGIVWLSNEVNDAASYIPTYGQRVYAEVRRVNNITAWGSCSYLVKAIKALQDKLNETRTYPRRPLPRYIVYRVSANQSSSDPSTPFNEPDKQRQEWPEVEPTSFLGISPTEVQAKSQLESEPVPAFAASGVSSVSVENHHNLHIMLPALDGNPYASLTVKGVPESLLICGQVNGPAYITEVEHSIIVVSCRQFHMHNCTDDDVYISCSSNPIIEECSNVRLGRIPKAYALNHDHLDNQDHWNEVEDFKWIRPEPSRNWSLLGPGDVVPEEVWVEIVPGGPGWSLEDILHAIRLVKT